MKTISPQISNKIRSRLGLKNSCIALISFSFFKTPDWRL